MSAPAHVRRVLDRLHGVKKCAKGWTAECPVHEDEHSSLSVSAGKDDRVLIFCHAGCPVEQIVAAIGFTMSDLFQEQE